jgi:hypothetical protein
LSDGAISVPETYPSEKFVSPKKLRFDEAKVEALGSDGHLKPPQSLPNDST